MPATALDVDWNEVRLLACQIGLKEAAERMGISYEAVRQRSCREQWLASIPRNQPMPPSVLRPVTNVTSAAQAQAASMRDDAIQGRAAALRAGRKALVKMAEKEPEELLTEVNTDMALKWTKQHATAAGYGSSDSVARIQLRVTGAHAVESEQPGTYEAEWSDATQVVDAKPTE